MTLSEDREMDARNEMDAEVEEFEHEAHYGHEAEWADDCRLCAQRVEEDAADAAEAEWERKATAL